MPSVPCRELSAHVLLVLLFDAAPAQLQLLRHVLDGAVATAPVQVIRKALGVQRVVGQKLQPLTLHPVTTEAGHPPHLELEVDAIWPAGQIASTPIGAVVPTRAALTAVAADRFFERRTSRTIRTRDHQARRQLLVEAGIREIGMRPADVFRLIKYNVSRASNSAETLNSPTLLSGRPRKFQTGRQNPSAHESWGALGETNSSRYPGRRSRTA